jgi:membrane protein YdbS with pleckstrin-like domain
MGRGQSHKRCVVKRFTEELSDSEKSTIVGTGYIIAVVFTFLLVDLGRNPLGVAIGTAALWFILVIAPMLIIYLGVTEECREAPRAS